MLRGVACYTSGDTNGTSATVNLSQAISLTANSTIGIARPQDAGGVAGKTVIFLSNAQVTNPFGLGTLLTLSGVVGMTEINGLTGKVSALGGATTAWSLTLDINSATFSAFSASGSPVATLVPTAGDQILLLPGRTAATATFVYPGGFNPITGLGNITTTNGGGTNTYGIAAKMAAGGETSFTVTQTPSGVRWNLMCVIFSGRAANPFTVQAVSTDNAGALVQTPIAMALNTLLPNIGDDLAMFSLAGGKPGGTNAWDLTAGPTSFIEIANCRPVGSAQYGPETGFCHLDSVNSVVNNAGTGAAATLTDGGANTSSYGAYVVSLAMLQPLVGWNGIGYFNIVSVGAQSTGGNSVYYTGGYAGTAGTIDTAWFYCGVLSSATSVKLCLYDAGGNKVAQSNPITLVANSLCSASLASGGALTAQTYTLVIVPNASYFNGGTYSGSSPWVNNQFASWNFSYSSPPATLPALNTGNGDMANNGNQVIAFFTGSPGVVSTDPGLFLRRGSGMLAPTRGFGRLI